ncbi:unnamed protein product, partial [marine sediment metagenome]
GDIIQMSHGNAFGDGIYTSTSLSYAKDFNSMSLDKSINVLVNLVIVKEYFDLVAMSEKQNQIRSKLSQYGNQWSDSEFETDSEVKGEVKEEVKKEVTDPNKQWRIILKTQLQILRKFTKQITYPIEEHYHVDPISFKERMLNLFLKKYGEPNSELFNRAYCEIDKLVEGKYQHLKNEDMLISASGKYVLPVAVANIKRRGDGQLEDDYIMIGKPNAPRKMIKVSRNLGTKILRDQDNLSQVIPTYYPSIYLHKIIDNYWSI